MPGGNGTGPMGYGPGVWGFGRGHCFRWRGGFGRDYLRYPTIEPIALTKEEQKKILEAEKENLKAELKRIEKKLNSYNVKAKKM